MIEAREQLVDLEQRLREAEELGRLARIPSGTETHLRKSLDATEKDILDWKDRMMHLETISEGLEKIQRARLKSGLAVSLKVLQRLRKDLESAEAQRMQVGKARSEAVSALRKKMVRAAETIRQLERKRDAMRNQAERRREAAAARLGELEGSAATGASDRALRDVQKSLKAIQAELGEVRRKLGRLRDDR